MSTTYEPRDFRYYDAFGPVIYTPERESCDHGEDVYSCLDCQQPEPTDEDVAELAEFIDNLRALLSE